MVNISQIFKPNISLTCKTSFQCYRMYLFVYMVVKETQKRKEFEKEEKEKEGEETLTDMSKKQLP